MSTIVLIVWLVTMLLVFPSFENPRRGFLLILFSGMLFLPEAAREPIVIAVSCREHMSEL